MNGLIGYTSAFLGWKREDVSDERRATALTGEESRLGRLFALLHIAILFLASLR